MKINAQKSTNTAINISALAPQTKRQVWQAIKRDKTALAELLESEEVQAIAKQFGAMISVEPEDLPPSAMDVLAGKQVAA